MCLSCDGSAPAWQLRTVVLTAVPAEDGDGWQVELEWDDGERQRILHFSSKKDAEFWIADPHL